MVAPADRRPWPFNPSLQPMTTGAIIHYMAIKTSQQIQISVVAPTVSAANCIWSEQYRDKILTVTIAGDAPLPITNALCMVNELRDKIRETVWQHYAKFDPAIKPENGDNISKTPSIPVAKSNKPR